MSAPPNGWNLPPRVAGGLLGVLGGLKCLSAALAWGALGQRADPVLALPMNWVMLASGLIEWGVAGVLLASGGPLGRKAWLMVVLALGWLLYRGLYAGHAGGDACPCLGQATLWFPWLAQFEGEILTSLALWFFLVGGALMAIHGLCKRDREAS